MDAIKLDAVIKDRHIIVDLPDDVSDGPIRLTIYPVVEAADDDMTVEQAHALLLAAGLLVNVDDLDIPDDIGEITVTEEELDELTGDVSFGRPIEDLINEERDEY